MKNTDKRYRDNYIHETAIIGEGVVMGIGNYIGPYCVISGDTRIGSGNRLERYVSIGAPAEHRDYFRAEFNKTIIGDSNIFREFVTVNAGTKGITVVDHNNCFLRGSHVGHDSIIESKCTISCNALIGGESYLQTGCNLALGAVIHQRSLIGAYSLVGMNSVVTKTARIAPGHVYAGAPARLMKKNQIGLNRAGVTDGELSIYKQKYEALLLDRAK